MCAMAVVHGVLDSARDIHLWAEDAPVEEEGRARAQPAFPSESRGLEHPFATRVASIETVTGQVSEYPLADPGLAVTLPTNARRPLPSTRVRDPRDSDITWTAWRVPTVCLEPADVLRLLLGLPERPDARLGSSILFFGRLALLATELVARGRFLPR